MAKNRVHLDVRAAPGLHGEARMAALEAEPASSMAAGFIVMTDLEGNEFCLA